MALILSRSSFVSFDNLQHAIVMAQGSATDHQPSLDCVADPAKRYLLKQACHRLFSSLIDDPFFEDEPSAEVGFALENQVRASPEMLVKNPETVR